MQPTLLLLLGSLLVYSPGSSGQMLSSTVRRVGKLQEVFAWTQLTYDVNGEILLSDRFGDVEETDNADDGRVKRQASFLDGEPRMNSRPIQQNQNPTRPIQQNQNPTRPIQQNQNPTNETGQFFIQYNNVPMGVERVGNRLFVTVPRRRYGIPATLNYIDLRGDARTRSPALRPYPSLRARTSLVSVYRTRADACGRLWMVDTGMLEIPDNRRQVQPPAIVIYDLRTNRQILRYPFKSTDLVTAGTPAGLASITVDVTADTCGDAFAYVPDLVTYGLIVFSLRENDSWRVTHNYFSFDPTQGNLNIAGQRFQWNDGIFSLALSPPSRDGCRAAYFHPMASTREFSVSTCVLRNQTASSSSDYWTRYNDLGHRGENSQSTIHDVHQNSGIVFFAEVMRSAVSCWNPKRSLSPSNVAILVQDNNRLSYPSDLHVTGDEVWLMANTLPRFIYSRLDTTQYNFFIYRATVADLISGTVCA